MASNPVFNRLDKQMNQGGYAGFGGGGRPRRPARACRTR